jgi:hypothetical protein
MDRLWQHEIVQAGHRILNPFMRRSSCCSARSAKHRLVPAGSLCRRPCPPGRDVALITVASFMMRTAAAGSSPSRYSRRFWP